MNITIFANILVAVACILLTFHSFHKAWKIFHFHKVNKIKMKDNAERFMMYCLYGSMNLISCYMLVLATKRLVQ